METSASTTAGKKEGKGAVLEGNGFVETGKKPIPLAATGAAVDPPSPAPTCSVQWPVGMTGDLTVF
uniref:Uncharacterized protein n=1 Tax=Nothoprocta perdicaria TaxID=30464 RepID=A0A8C6ZJ39_NOTPE